MDDPEGMTTLKIPNVKLGVSFTRWTVQFLQIIHFTPIMNIFFCKDRPFPSHVIVTFIILT